MAWSVVLCICSGRRGNADVLLEDVSWSSSESAVRRMTLHRRCQTLIVVCKLVDACPEGFRFDLKLHNPSITISHSAHEVVDHLSLFDGASFPMVTPQVGLSTPRMYRNTDPIWLLCQRAGERGPAGNPGILPAKSWSQPSRRRRSPERRQNSLHARLLRSSRCLSQSINFCTYRTPVAQRDTRADPPPRRSIAYVRCLCLLKD